MVGRWRPLAGLALACIRLLSNYARPEMTGAASQPLDGVPSSAAVLEAPESTKRRGYVSLLPWAGYLAAVLAGELAMPESPWVGMVLYVNVLILLLAHASLLGPRERPLALALTVVPLIRILGVVVAMAGSSMAGWYLLTSLPILAVGAGIAKATGLTWRQLGVSTGNVRQQMAIGLLGLPLGIGAYLVLKPAPLIPALSWQELVIPGVVLLVCTGLAEEFLFRGLIQLPAISILGRWGLIYGSALFAILNLGNPSALGSVLLFVAGLGFAWLVARTGSLLGVSLAHGVANVGLYLVIPFLALQLPVGSPGPLAAAVPTLGTGPVAIAPTAEVTSTPSSLPGVSRPMPAPSLLSPGTLEAQGPTGPRPSTGAATPSALPATARPAAGEVLAAPAPTPTVQTERYVVQPGDSLFFIALRHDITVDALMAMNGLTDRSFIRSGQVLIVPKTRPGATVLPTTQATAGITSQATAVATRAATPTPTTSPTLFPSPSPSRPTATVSIAGWEAYRVQSGDSLFTIAMARGTTVEALMERNGLTDRSTIYTGQEILVPRSPSRP